MPLPAALRAFEPGQIRKEAALRIALRCRGFFRLGAQAGLAGVGSARPAVDLRPFGVVMAGKAGRTSNGRTGSDPEGSSPKDCSQVPRLSSAVGVATGAGVGTRIRTAAATAPAKRTPAPTSRTVFSPLTKAITAECSRPGRPATARVPDELTAAARPRLWMCAVKASDVDTRSSRMAPSAATPIETPARRKVLLIPEAIPDRAGSTVRSAEAARLGFASPIPIPPTMKPGRT